MFLSSFSKKKFQLLSVIMYKPGSSVHNGPLLYIHLQRHVGHMGIVCTIINPLWMIYSTFIFQLFGSYFRRNFETNVKRKGWRSLVPWCIWQVSYIKSSRSHTFIKPLRNLICHVLWSMFTLDAI
jgi:hypothetical protein